MNFGEAIQAMKDGKRVSRRGWNGKGQYIELASNIRYINTRGEVVNADHAAIGNMAVAFVGTSGVQLGWLASQADMLADDWEVKPEKLQCGFEKTEKHGASVNDLFWLSLLMFFFSLELSKGKETT